MILDVFSRRGLAGIAAACLVSVALPAAPAMAQKVKTKPTAEQPAASAPPSFTVTIPSVETAHSNMDGETIRAILSGALVENADALAGLDAGSITVPEIVLSITTNVDGKSEEGTLTFTNLVFDDVTHGIAASVSLDGSRFETPEGSGEMGAMSAANVNIGGILGIYGLVDAGGSTEMQLLYSDFLIEGGTFTAEEFSCEIGAVSGADVSGRPLKTSMLELFQLAQELEANPDEPSPELMGQVFRMYADILTAFESSESSFDGFACEGFDDEGRPMTFSLAGMNMGAMSPGIYPALSMNGLVIEVEGDGAISLDNFTLKEFDLRPTIATLESAPDLVNEAWLEANVRGLIPSFAGFSLSGFDMDIPDPDADGERIAANIDGFDLTLSGYVNGIPSAIDTSASGIKASLPQDSDDEQIQQLLALGITDIDAGFRLAAAWDQATSSIDIEEVSVSGVDLATVVLSGTLSNATNALFSLDENTALMAGMGVAVKALNLDVTDAGLSDIILAVVAAEQGADPTTLRPVFAGLAEGTVIGMLAGAADAAKLGSAINQFVSGTAKSLSIGIVAKNDPGLGMLDFAAAEQDPTVLLGKVDITATAK